MDVWVAWFFERDSDAWVVGVSTELETAQALAAKDNLSRALKTGYFKDELPPLNWKYGGGPDKQQWWAAPSPGINHYIVELHTVKTGKDE